jgi:ABC-type phosphate transport system substrate-binding protein
LPTRTFLFAAAWATGALLLAAPTKASPQTSTSGSYIVIVNANNPVSALTRDQVSRLFLKKAHWATGRPVQPVDLAETSPVRAAFTKEIHRRAVPAVKSYWRQQIFSGQEVPPVERTSDSEVIAFVADNPDAIGYAFAGADVGEKVKIVSIAR